MISVATNARFRNRPMTGVERFASEVCNLLENRDDVKSREITPSHPRRGMRGHLWEQWNLPGQLKQDEILFSPCNTGPIRTARQLPVIHDAAVWDCPQMFSRNFRTVYQQILPRLANRSPSIATVSEYSRERLAHHLRIPEERIHVLGNATGSQFAPAEADPTDSGENSAPTLLCVGSLDPRKNFSTLIHAWADLKEKGSLPQSATLKIIGAANPANFAQFESGDAPGVQWLGRISDEDLVRQYQAATAFIFPSIYEGFGLPPLEAMACGCPVLLSRAASLPEVGGTEFVPGESDSKGGVLYFDPLSKAEIANSIERLFQLDEDQLARLKRNALDRAGNFSWEAVTERTVESLNRIA